MSRVCNWSAWGVAIEVLVMLQLESCLSCNSSNKNYKKIHVQSCNWSAWGYAIEVFAVLQSERCWVAIRLINFFKNYISRVATEVFEELQLKCLSCCNSTVCWVAIHLIKKIITTASWPNTSSGLSYTSCNWSARGVAIEVLSVLQLECLLSCNLSTKNYKIYMSRLATEAFEKLQLKCFPSCNWSAYWVAIEVYLKSCNWSASRVATRVLVELQFVW
jgi:hypothetical protein